MGTILSCRPPMMMMPDAGVPIDAADGGG
jgi:hypothetical protein